MIFLIFINYLYFFKKQNYEFYSNDKQNHGKKLPGFL